MKKSLVFVSVVASVMLLNGCGSSGGGGDTVAPKFNFSTYSFDAPEGKPLLVDLSPGIKDTDKNIVYKVSEGSYASIVEGSKLKFSAPSYKEGASTYKVKVIATDSAKNASAPQEFVFNVKKDLANGGYALNPNYVAKTNDKNFTKDGGYLKDPSGLLWNDKVSEPMNYATAASYCKDGWRLPTRGELLNIIDYSKGNSTGTKSLIDSDFKNYSKDSYDSTWVKEENSQKFNVNHKSGADTQKDIVDRLIPHRVLCVYGTPAASNPMSSNLTWTKIKDTVIDIDNTQGSSGYGSYGTYTQAVATCTNQSLRLPTINELRSIIDYSTNTMPLLGTPSGLTTGNYKIWSSTKNTNDKTNDSKDEYYMIHLDGNISKSGVVADISKAGNTHYVTCVKKK